MKCSGGVNKLVLWPETGARVCVLQVTNGFSGGVWVGWRLVQGCTWRLPPMVTILTRNHHCTRLAGQIRCQCSTSESVSDLLLMTLVNVIKNIFLSLA